MSEEAKEQNDEGSNTSGSDPNTNEHAAALSAMERLVVSVEGIGSDGGAEGDGGGDNEDVMGGMEMQDILNLFLENTELRNRTEILENDLAMKEEKAKTLMEELNNFIKQNQELAEVCMLLQQQVDYNEEQKKAEFSAYEETITKLATEKNTAVAQAQELAGLVQGDVVRSAAKRDEITKLETTNARLMSALEKINPEVAASIMQEIESEFEEDAKKANDKDVKKDIEDKCDPPGEMMSVETIAEE